MTRTTVLPSASSASASAWRKPRPSPSGRTWVVSRKRWWRRTEATSGDPSSVGAPFARRRGSRIIIAGGGGRVTRRRSARFGRRAAQAGGRLVGKGERLMSEVTVPLTDDEQAFVEAKAAERG